MLFYSIGLPLPSSIKEELNSLTYGLPQVDWIEIDQLFIPLRQLGFLNNLLLTDIQKALTSVSYFNFSIRLQQVETSQTRRGDGSIWVGVTPIEPLTQLKREIDKWIKHLIKLPHENTHKLNLILGKYSQLPAHKLIDYLVNHSLFQSELITFSKFNLYAQHTQHQSSYLQIIQQYHPQQLNFND